MSAKIYHLPVDDTSGQIRGSPTQDLCARSLSSPSQSRWIESMRSLLPPKSRGTLVSVAAAMVTKAMVATSGKL
jgi:hypothetical protein